MSCNSGDDEADGQETLPENWSGKELALSDELYPLDENKPTEYAMSATCFEEAEEWFLSMVGGDVSETSSGYAYSQSGLGSLTFTKDGDESDEIYATLDVVISALKSKLTKITFMSPDALEHQLGGDASNSFKGTPYFAAGDIIRRKSDNTIWMCVHPAGGPSNKDYSYWIALKPFNNDEKEQVGYHSGYDDPNDLSYCIAYGSPKTDKKRKRNIHAR